MVTFTLRPLYSLQKPPIRFYRWLDGPGADLHATGKLKFSSSTEFESQLSDSSLRHCEAYCPTHALNYGDSAKTNEAIEYSGVNSTKSPSSGAGNVSDPRLTSQVGIARSRVRVDQCFSAVGAVQVPVLVCLRSRCSHVTEVGEP